MAKEPAESAVVTDLEQALESIMSCDMDRLICDDDLGSVAGPLGEEDGGRTIRGKAAARCGATDVGVERPCWVCGCLKPRTDFPNKGAMRTRPS